MTFFRISLNKQHVYPSYASVSRNRNNLFGGLGRVMVMVGVRVRVGIMVSVRVISLRDSFSVLLRPQHHSRLRANLIKSHAVPLGG